MLRLAGRRGISLIFLYCVATFTYGICLTPEARQKGFVYLHEIDPTIQVSVRYATNENFVGRPIDGYKKPVVIITQQAAKALKAVQETVKRDGYSLVVYDAYRPQEAVSNFMRWSEKVEDQSKKSSYYPRVNKADVFDLGYVAKRSGHSRGSTVDLTLIKDGQRLHAVQVQERILQDGFMIQFLDDGTVDMGSSFDLFHEVSYYMNNLITEEFQTMRTYLKQVMEQHGFKNYVNEWWHFTLKDELYPADQDSSYFNFPVE